MDNDTLDQLGGMAVFVQVVDTGSFTAAGRRLGLDKSAVSKQVSRLEAQLGQKLLHRTTRALSLTEAGQLLYDRAAQSLEALAEARQALGQLAITPSGTLRLTTSVAFGRLCIAPLIPEFLARHPQLKLRCSLLDRTVDLAEEGYDMAIRISPRLADNLVARPLGEVTYRLCASPDYLARHPAVQTPADLTAHNCLYYGNNDFSNKWTFQQRTSQRLALGQQDAQRETVQVGSNFVINSSEVIRDAVLRGMGIGLLPLYAVEEALSQGRLCALLPEWEAEGPFGTTAYAVWLPNRHLPLKVRLFVDYLVEKLGGGGTAISIAQPAIP
jgi:DNA-binding transcriptional LysR family regulator